MNLAIRYPEQFNSRIWDNVNMTIWSTRILTRIFVFELIDVVHATAILKVVRLWAQQARHLPLYTDAHASNLTNAPSHPSFKGGVNPNFFETYQVL